jgi:3-phosphoshikimate 1-carboxyvinyltransferase
MKKITKFPSGDIRVPPSKSIAHRAVICAQLANAPLKLPDGLSDDIDATRSGIAALLSGELEIDCAESGSTLRFLVPIAAALGIRAQFTGRGRLFARPMIPLYTALAANGAQIAANKNGAEVYGRLEPGAFALPGDVSSQYVTGLLLALPLLGGDSEILLTSPLQSRSYVDVTLDVMAKFGVSATETERGYHIPGRQKYSPCELEIEGDYSQAAFFLVAQAFGRDVRGLGLNPESKQGDRAILDILCRSVRDSELYATDVDASDIPDLVPPVAALLSCATGTSRIYNAGRLRLKESDRLEAISTELSKLGADIIIDGDALIIHGKPALHGGTVDSHDDHRIAMMAALAAIKCDRDVYVTDEDCVRKSYPNFWEDWEHSCNG